MKQAPRWALIIKSVLKDRGLSQADLKEALQVETQGAVSHYFTGKRELSVSQLESLAKFLGLDPNYLLGISSKSNSPDFDKVLRPILETWVVRFGEMNWVEYKKDPSLIVDLLASELSSSLSEQKCADSDESSNRQTAM